VKWIALLGLVGCNQILDLRQTARHDAAYFDAPTDAPFACPIAATPQFSRVLKQTVAQPAGYYAVTTSGRAIAACINDDYFYSVCEGPVDGPLARVTLSPSPGQYAFVPRLSQDGQRMYVVSNTNVLLAFRRNTDDTWTQFSPPGLPGVALFLSPLAATANGDRFLISGNGVQFDEWTDEGGTWHMTHSHPVGDFGVGSLSMVAITADGLHALLLGTSDQIVYYTARDAVDSPFRTGTPIAGLPRSAQLYLTSDCARIYATGLGSIFYAQQQ